MVFALYTSRRVPLMTEPSIPNSPPLSDEPVSSKPDIHRLPQVQIFNDKHEFMKVLVCRNSHCSNVAFVDIATQEDADVARFAATMLCADPNVLITFSSQTGLPAERAIPGSDSLIFKREELKLYPADFSYKYPKAQLKKDHDSVPYSSISLVPRSVCPWVLCLENSVVKQVQDRLDRSEVWRNNMAQYRYDALCSGLWPPVPHAEFRFLFPMDRFSLCDIAPPKMVETMSNAVSDFASWDPFTFNEDELLVAAYLMIRNILGTEAEGGEVSLGGEILHLPETFESHLLWLLLTIRCCYCTNHYHNFRHAIDVMQATYSMITLPGACYPSGRPLDVGDKLATLLAAIGHDLFHPGIALGTLRHSNCPWPADENSLEIYHARMYCGVAAELTPELFHPKVSEIVSSMIAATELKRHSEFLTVDGDCNSRARLHWLSQIVKAADISNCARAFPISKKHALSLAQEFMEESQVLEMVNVKTQIPIPRIKSAAEWPKLQPLQQHFADKMARPLFEVLADANNGYGKLLTRLSETMAYWNEAAQSSIAEETASIPVQPVNA